MFFFFSNFKNLKYYWNIFAEKKFTISRAPKSAGNPGSNSSGFRTGAEIL